MITLDDLTGIDEKSKREAVEVLDDLMAYKLPGTQRSVISGYNWYGSALQSDSRVTFSNIHESEDYKAAMIEDLKKLDYRRRYIAERIREKGGTFFWNPEYSTRNNKDEILGGLTIKNLKTGRCVDLRKYRKPLNEYKRFKNSKGRLIAEGYGWEIDIPFRKKERLIRLVDLFLRKAGLFIHNEDGKRLRESVQEKKLRAPWPDAYRDPVLLIGEIALKYLDQFPEFDETYRLSLVRNNNEISFVIHKNLDFLRNLPHYENLCRLGFSEQRCLANKPFLKVVDQI